MTHDHDVDPLLLTLARLPAYAPRVDRDTRIRQRCHAVLDRRNAARARERDPRTYVWRIGEVALAAVLCGYASLALLQALALVQAIRLIH